ncbi:adhesin, partial [Serratia fonticola]|nr:adhesin [Serratia fonticola]
LGQDAVAIGMGAISTHDNDVALGAGSVTAATVATTGATIGGNPYAFAGTAPTSTVSVGDVGAERTITNVAAGRLSDTSTDAVNGSQLKATNDQVDINTTKIINNTTDIDGLKDDALQWDPSLNAYSADHMGNGPAKITNVAAGDVTDTSTDAINGSQLKKTNDQVDINTTNIATNTTDITNLGDTVENIYNTGTKYFHANSTGTDSSALGQDSVAIGMGAVSNSDTSVALGSGSVATKGAGIAGYLPTGSSAAQIAAINATTSTLGAVSVGDADNGQFRQINGVAAGTADSDAVNVAQLQGAIGASTADAVMYDNSTHNSVTLGGDTYNSTTKIGGTKITNVAAGEISATSSDAVNGSQLNDTNEQVA